jgi:hypothetical protein
MNSYNQQLQSYPKFSHTLICPPTLLEKPPVGFRTNLHLKVSQLRRYSTDPTTPPLKQEKGAQRVKVTADKAEVKAKCSHPPHHLQRGH